MPSDHNHRHLTQELSKRYLSGELSPREMYTVEDRMLESDFYFEAMEGLERLPWNYCQSAVTQTQQRIIEEFKIRPQTSWTQTRVVVATMALAVAGLGIYWLIQSTGPDTMDLTPKNPSPAATDSSKEPAVNSSTSDTIVSVTDTSLLEASVKQNPETTPDINSPINDDRSPVSTQIAVGRIVDTKGLALENVLVRVGETSDTTDKSGYYALKVPSGPVKIQVQHADLIAEIDANTYQNWEIVLDLEGLKVRDSYPIKGANRFK